LIWKTNLILKTWFENKLILKKAIWFWNQFWCDFQKEFDFENKFLILKNLIFGFEKLISNFWKTNLILKPNLILKKLGFENRIRLWKTNLILKLNFWIWFLKSNFSFCLDALALDVQATAQLAKLNVVNTDDLPKFDGKTSSKGTVVALFDGKVRNLIIILLLLCFFFRFWLKCFWLKNQEFVQSFKGGKHNVGIILDRTNFYAEAGGQVADIGEFVLIGEKNNNSEDEAINVTDTQRFAGFVLHSCAVPSGTEIKVLVYFWFYFFLFLVFFSCGVYFIFVYLLLLLLLLWF
jgi:hypothetical protein